MKNILMAVQPKWLAKILNGEKTVEVRTRVPKDFVGEIHLACTKGKPYLYYGDLSKQYEIDNYKNSWGDELNGKVVAKFDYDYKKVDEYPAFWFENTGIKELDYLVFPEEKEKMCLEDNDLRDYGKGKPLFAIPLTKLVAFDKPRELGEYATTFIPDGAVIDFDEYGNKYFYRKEKPAWQFYFSELKRCPQSYQFVYVEEEK